jgi:zinc-binding alcohol dehydrogenase/oxidoreductase
LGSDGAGIANGKAVIINPSLNFGDNPQVQVKDYRILGLPDNGTLAEYCVVPSANIVAKPKHLTWEQAAALPLAGLTAYRALFTKCQAKAGEKVLISGVGGGAALFALQFAVAAGCEVYVTSSSTEKIERAVAMGAKGGVNYKNEGWSKELSVLSGGIDVVIDSAAGAGFAEFARVANPGGRIAFFGGTAGTISGLNPQLVFWKQLSIFGTTMGTSDEFAKMVRFVNKHKIIPVVDSVYTLEQGNEAFARMDAGAQFGKIVVTI